MDYKDIYEPPKRSEDSPNPEQKEVYQIPDSVPQNQSAFYGDANAPIGQTPEGQLYDTTPPEPEVNTMNRKIYSACIVIAILIFLLAVYCMGSDLMKGAIGGSAGTVPPVTVNLNVEQKPELNPEDENVNEDGEYTVRGVSELVSPSIVMVYNYGGENQETASVAGSGSGIIISEDGYIVTNAHVVANGVSFSVRLSDETESEAVLIGSDNKTDLAVLKIEAHDLPIATLGDSDEVNVGDNVVAIGNPAGFTNTVTKGIVSGIGREIRAGSSQTGLKMECIQTDAAISPGNSGGALVNMYGQVIGITSSKYASSFMSSNAYEGLGFAISINQALPIITDLMEQGYVSNRFRIGIVLSSADTEYVQEEFQKNYGVPMPDELKKSIWISDIAEECDIHNTELQSGDFILSMNGSDVASYDDVQSALDGCKGGDIVSASCARFENGKVRYFEITFKLEEDTSGNF